MPLGLSGLCSYRRKVTHGRVVQSIVPTNGRERTGYATQKPIQILERIVKIHTNPGELVMDFFAGSGTTGEAAAKWKRDFVLVDNNPDAVEVMAKRLAHFSPEVIGLFRGEGVESVSKTSSDQPEFPG